MAEEVREVTTTFLGRNPPIHLNGRWLGVNAEYCEAGGSNEEPSSYEGWFIHGVWDEATGEDVEVEEWKVEEELERKFSD